MRVPTIWKDRAVEFPKRYKETSLGDGYVQLDKAPGTVREVGTPQNAANYNSIEAGILDAQVAAALLTNAVRQNAWEIETGTVELTNSRRFPFNNSQVSVALEAWRESTDYVVLTEVTDFTGNVGEIEITDRLTNGFKVAYTGSASGATIKYKVVGGYMK